MPIVLAVSLLPKCALCVAGYLAVATGLGIATPELCGAVAGEANSPAWGPGVSTGVFCVGAVWLAKFAQNRGGARPPDAL